jgi:hypothetical protein
MKRPTASKMQKASSNQAENPSKHREIWKTILVVSVQSYFMRYIIHG